VPSSGSFHPHDDSLINLKRFSHASHWYHIWLAQENIFIELSGIGKFPLVAERIWDHLMILAISDIRTESLALEDWLQNERKAIVAKIESMTITTMSSTSVNAFGIWKDDDKAFFECDILFKFTLNM
jgi:hypothetical protein